MLSNFYIVTSQRKKKCYVIFYLFIEPPNSNVITCAKHPLPHCWLEMIVQPIAEVQL